MGAALVGASQRYFRPAVATWSLTISSVLAAVATISAAAMTIVGFVHVAPVTGWIVAWCLGTEHHPGTVPWVETAVAATWLAVAAVRVWRCRRSYLALVPDARSDEVEVVDGDEPVAYTLPGRCGRIVVSSGMLGALDPAEQRVLLAHETSHLRRRHDRFLLAVDLGVAVVPLLHRMARSVRFATERWADEDAARAVGDRRLVARAVTRAALVQHASVQPGMALAGLGVRARVDQLLAAPTRPTVVRATLVVTAGLTATVAASSTLQVHHLAMVAERLCGGG
jgi:beta-lactamase regulating signal transducer with metallopeptidase domain